MWKSRADKLPPSSYFSMIAAYLQRAHDARISRELMEMLRPYFIEAWRNGKSAEAAAQTTCSCRHGEVVPSPVVGIRIAKGSVRPPKNAERGEVFGADELRPPAAVERLSHRLERLTQQQSKQEEVAARWAKRAQSARKEATQKEAAHKQAAASTKHAALLAEARRIEVEITRLQRELNRPAAMRPVSDEPPKAPATTQAPAPTAAPIPAKTPRKKSATAATAETATPTGEEAAMLRAIQGLMPQLAGQLATEMSKERGLK
ncbi:MAG: hypothetical protein U1A78_33910 [Polyangia bacterium]